MLVALPLFTAVATVVLVFAEWRAWTLVRIVSKTLASTGFVVLGLAGGALSAGMAGKCVMVALVLCMGGDLFLLSRDKRFFLAGLVTFLLGHVAYCAAFVALGVDLWTSAAAAIPLGAFAIAVWRWLGPKTGSLRRAVVAYIIVITTMVVLAAGAWGANPTIPMATFLVAAVLFFLSDLFVARDRFAAPGPVNRAIGLPLYYAGQVLFAFSIGWMAS